MKCIMRAVENPENTPVDGRRWYEKILKKRGKSKGEEKLLDPEAADDHDFADTKNKIPNKDKSKPKTQEVGGTEDRNDFSFEKQNESTTSAV